MTNTVTTGMRLTPEDKCVLDKAAQLLGVDGRTEAVRQLSRQYVAFATRQRRPTGSPSNGAMAGAGDPVG
jgi:hypothetical protein